MEAKRKALEEQAEELNRREQIVQQEQAKRQDRGNWTDIIVQGVATVVTAVASKCTIQ